MQYYTNNSTSKYNNGHNNITKNSFLEIKKNSQ